MSEESGKIIGDLREVTSTAKTARILALQIAKDVHDPISQFCDIPARYAHCLLDHAWIPEAEQEKLSDEMLEALMGAQNIINPRKSHMSALTFFKLLFNGFHLVCRDKSPFNPRIGLYLVGIPGSGKTHILAAAAKVAHGLLWQQLNHYVSEIEAEIEKFLRINSLDVIDGMDDIRIWENKTGSSEKIDPKTAKLLKLLENCRKKLSEAPIQARDVLYIGFDQLYELIQDKPELKDRLLDSITKARLVFIDDLHPKGDPKRFALIHHIIETRYEGGQRGTFLSTNLEVAQIGEDNSKSGSQLTKRIQSRCDEGLWTVKFGEDCVDWRRKVRKREVDKIAGFIAANSELEWKKQSKQAGLILPSPKAEE